MSVIHNTALADAKAICTSAESQVDINRCAVDRFEEADLRLNDLYNTKLANLKRDENKRRLTDSQNAWILFRDKACTYEAGQVAAGSMYPMFYNNCLGRITAQRVEDLKGYLVCDDNGCPR